MEELIKVWHPDELTKILKEVCIEIHRQYCNKCDELKTLETIWLVANNIELLLKLKTFFADQYIIPIDFKKAFEMSALTYTTPSAIICKDKIVSIIRQKYDVELIIDYRKAKIEFILI